MKPLLIDADRWPDLARVPDVPVRARVARRLFTRAVRRLPLTVVGPNGLALAGAGVPGGGGPVLRVRRPREFLNRIGADGLIGFGEAYQTGAWTTASGDELAALLEVLAGHVADLVPKPLQRLRGLQVARMPRSEHGDPRGARNNARAHYDLSNELFALFLDPSMTYSSALFDPAVGEGNGVGAGEPDLHAAQLRKIDAVLDAADVREGTRLLEIGSGWGALAMRAAGERGATVTTLTLSQEQMQLARKNIAEAGLSDRIDVRYADYREVDLADQGVGGESRAIKSGTNDGGGLERRPRDPDEAYEAHATYENGTQAGSDVELQPRPYDAVVSVEMIEAVGRRFLPDYFQAVERLLAPGGRAVIQAITMAHHRMLATQDTYTWMHKYVFPGGMIPSVEELDRVAGQAGLRLTARRDFGQDYARTLRAWRHRFEENWPQIAELGFDDVFRRTWRFYLAYCEAGFASRYLDVSHLTFDRPR